VTGVQTCALPIFVFDATDAEISLSFATKRVQVAEPGTVLIPADKLRGIVQAEDNEPDLTLETDGNDCHITGQDAHFTVFGYPPTDLPETPTFSATVAGTDTKSVFSVDGGDISNVVSKTIFAVARETSRYAINGVLLKRTGKSIELVATDGRRLAFSTTKVGDAQKGDSIACIVPTKALNLLLRLASGEERVHIAVTDHRAVFAIGDPNEAGGPRATLSTSLVEGTFPPYEDVIPKDSDKKAVFDRDVLGSAVKRASLLTNEESRGVRLHFKASDKQLELASRAPEMGESTINVDLPSYDGDDIEIGFNPQFIADALKVIGEPEVTFELKAPNRPGLIRSGDDFLYVVMPVNLP